MPKYAWCVLASRRQFDIVYLRGVEGLSYAQIAELLGVSSSGAMSRIYKAGRKLLQEREEAINDFETMFDDEEDED